jgi:hypothetical protein
MPNGQLTCHQRGDEKKVPQVGNVFSRRELFCDDIVTGRPRDE